MPFYREQLASALPSDLLSDAGAPPPRVDPARLNSSIKGEFGYLYQPNPARHLPRNYCQDTRAASEASKATKTPKFLSNQQRDAAFGSLESQPTQHGEPPTITEIESLKPEATEMYRRYEIIYSRFGVDDFDFG